MDLSNFGQHFNVSPATTPKEIKACQRVRYDVYVMQQQYELPNPSKEEKDGLDVNASHNLVTYRDGTPVATARLIHGSSPIYDLVDNKLLPKKEICSEISRFSVNHDLIRELVENEIKSGLNKDEVRLLKTHRSMLSSVLMKHNMITAMQAGKPYLLGVTERRVIRKMNTLGFAMEFLGDEIEYHGIRQPFLFRVDKTFCRLKKVNQQYWEYMSNGGVLHQQADDLVNSLGLHN